MKLGEKQELFPLLLMSLVHYIYGKGYKIRWGDGFRAPRLHGAMGVKKGYGHKNSCHKLKLAQDINLFKDGKFLTSTKAHAVFGEYWKSLNPLCCWGGDFKKKDGNHYSITHNGHM
jgi:hypothetical protein